MPDTGTCFGHLFLNLQKTKENQCFCTPPCAKVWETPNFTCMGTLFRLRYRRDVAKKLQFYMHGNAFSNFRMHLSSTRLKQMNFRKVFNKSISLPKCFTHRQQNVQFYIGFGTLSDMCLRNFIKNANLPDAFYTSLTECAISHWFWHIF